MVEVTDIYLRICASALSHDESRSSDELVAAGRRFVLLLETTWRRMEPRAHVSIELDTKGDHPPVFDVCAIVDGEEVRLDCWSARRTELAEAHQQLWELGVSTLWCPVSIRTTGACLNRIPGLGFDGWPGPVDDPFDDGSSCVWELRGFEAGLPPCDWRYRFSLDGEAMEYEDSISDLWPIVLSAETILEWF
jgi:hypothetical protein